MQVLVLGASGSIGFPVARAFRRAGYKVYGLVRSEEKAHKLALEEIIPVVGDVKDIPSWRPTLEKVTTVVDCSSSYPDKVAHAQLVLATVKAVSESRRLVFIYNSGSWVYNNNPYEITSENTAYTPLPLVAWRDPMDASVLAAESKTLFPVVIRPTSVYGYAQSLLGAWFKGATEGKLEVYGKPTTRYNFVHMDDNAEVFVRAAERADVVKGNLFIVSGGNESLLDALTAVSRVTGYKGEITFKEPHDALSEGYAINNVLSTRKARVLLGWESKHKSFVDDIDSLYVAWKAHRQ
jgi:nucleoside-diphosphate-sugar epimerase